MHTADKRFSGGLAGSNPPLSAAGRAQASATAAWLAPIADQVNAVVSSPVLRARQTADEVAAALGHEVIERPAFTEIDFGRWEGLTFAEVHERYPEEMAAWFDSLGTPPGGADESFRDVQQRVLSGLRDLVAQHPGGLVVVVSHVTPIKVLVAHAVGAPLEAIYRMELSPASVTVLDVHPRHPDATDPVNLASLRLFNAVPHDDHSPGPLRPR